MRRDDLLLFLALLLLSALGSSCSNEDPGDFDQDGVEDYRDCAPDDSSVYPGATDLFGDGVDSDCDGGDGADRDGDGFPSNVTPDDPFHDCDDNNPLVNPGAFDLVSDGADRNCDGHAGIDGDGDGYASLASEGTDCDDTEDSIHPDSADPYGDQLDQDCSGNDGVDADGDGYPAEDEDYTGDPVAWDCNDSNALIYPGAPELEGDGLDNDCDGYDAADSDQDGHVSDVAGGDDCDDANPNSYPGAPEQPDGADNDCDGTVDEGTDLYDDDGDGFSEVAGDCDDSNALLSPADVDADGFTLCDGDCDDGDAGMTPADLDQDGLSGCLGDCDDFNPLINPSAPEVCNLVDDNCDGLQTDEQDADSDGSPACGDCDDSDPLLDGLDADGDFFSSCQGDCDDGQPLINPFAPDATGDGLDQNCDGADGMDADGDGAASSLSGGSDCNDTDPALNQSDADGDGVSSCDGDCEDGDPTVYPGANDICGDGIDQDCVGGPTVESDDDGDGAAECDGDCDDTDATLNPADVDGDGSSTCDGDCDDGDVTLNLADADTDGYASCDGDCDDLSAAVNPGASEQCNLVDDNCDGVLLTAEADDDGDGDPLCTDCDDNDGDSTTLDADGDGFDTCTGEDCDDNSLVFNPVALDGYGDGFDTNCDGIDGIDADGDGFASAASAGPDCDDSDPAVNPLGTELPLDGIDQDCDGLDAADDDGDGYASIVTGGDDCDDGDASVYPGFFETPDNGADDNCDGADGNTYLAFTGTSAFNATDGTGWRPGTTAACDLDGDGVLDLAIGSPWWDADPATSGSSTDEGLVGIWYGPVVGGAVVAGSPTRLRGPSGYSSLVGYSLACLGDTDGDGLEELAIGAPASLPTSAGSSEGVVFLVQGSLSGEIVLDSQTASAAYTRILNLTYGYGGYLGGYLDAGDFDGDGVPDLLVGEDAPPFPDWPPTNNSYQAGAWIVSGPIVDMTDASLEAVATLESGLLFGGGSNLMRRFASAGDTNGDGIDDLLMAVPEADVNGDGSPDGAVYVFQGPVAGTLGPSAAQATITGTVNYPAGFSVDGVGDLNNDGMDDVAVTVQYPGSSGSEGVHLFFGPVLGALQLEFADAIVASTAANTYLEEPSVARIGDVDGDGLGDLLIAFGSWSGSTDQIFGGARVMFGPFGGVRDLFDSNSEPLGEEGGQLLFGAAAERSVDVNGDGFPDPFVLRPARSGGGGATSVRVYVNPYDP